MIFSLDVRRAEKGDCLILHYGSANEPGLILIDGGPANVYKPHLRPRLDEIKAARGLSNDASLPVDLLMVSHIDDDHIHGILELTKELAEAQGKRPLLVKVRSFWHNTFEKIIGNDPDELTGAVTAQFGAASLAGEIDTEGLEPIAARVLASVGQGVRLQADARKLGLKNRQFDEGLVAAQEGSVDMGKGLTFTVAGPLAPELDALQKSYEEFLKKQEEEKKKKEVLASFTDDSVPNLSSIVVVAEVGGKRILLTGDARGDKVLKGLEQVGLLEEGDDNTMHVDILKLPHHGSERNVEEIFFRRVTADHYVASANGEHGNPDRAMLQMILDVRGEDDDYTIHLTYPLEELDVEREKDWNKQQARKKPANRQEWSHEEHSLTAFFDEHKKMAQKLSIVDKTKPHVIDLLDELGF